MRDKHLIWAWAIKNILVMGAWTALAIIFNRWWIALFAILCMSSLESQYKSYRICDNCGAHSPYADNHNDALKKAKESGWLHIVDSNKDYCPECIKKFTEEAISK